MKSIINAHNRKVLSDKNETNRRTCNCHNQDTCPLNGYCLAKESLYEATIKSDLPNYKEKLYKGISEPPFKKRFKNHEKSFNHKEYMNDSALSQEVWKIKEKGGSYQITWNIVRKCPGYNPETKRCILCLSEKLDIAQHEGSDLLNKRSEIISKCRHQNKYALAKLDSND